MVLGWHPSSNGQGETLRRNGPRVLLKFKWVEENGLLRHSVLSELPSPLLVDFHYCKPWKKPLIQKCKGILFEYTYFFLLDFLRYGGCVYFLSFFLFVLL